MIWNVPALLKDIFAQGRHFPWPRPDGCPRCHSVRLWGHGFVGRYFDGFATCLLLKCYRCPDCGCVITLRPDSHFPRIRSAKQTIRAHLAHRLDSGRWPPSCVPRPRLRHWLVHLMRRVQAHLSCGWKEGIMAGFERLLTLGVVPVGRLR